MAASLQIPAHTAAEACPNVQHQAASLRTEGSLQRELREAKSRRITALLLAVLLGFAGIHNHYLGYSCRGYVQLIMSVVGLATWNSGIGIILLTTVALWVLAEVLIIYGSADPFRPNSYREPLIES